MTRPPQVLNLSHATDSEELLGGVKPVSVAESAKRLFDDVTRLFARTFPVDAPVGVARGHVSSERGGEAETSRDEPRRAEIGETGEMD